MKGRWMVVILLFLAFLNGMYSPISNTSLASNKVEILNLSVIHWGQEQAFSFTVYGKKGMKVRVAPFVDVIDGEKFHEFEKDGKWYVNARISRDVCALNGPMVDAIVRSRIPGESVKIPLIFEEYVDGIHDADSYETYIPISNYIPIVGMPDGIAGDIASDDVISRVGDLVYIKRWDGSIVRDNTGDINLTIFNGSLYPIKFMMDHCSYTVVEKHGLIDNSILLTWGYISLHLDTCLKTFSVAENMAFSLNKGECAYGGSVQIDTIYAEDISLPLNVNVNVCSEDNVYNSGEDKAAQNSSANVEEGCSISSSSLLQDYYHSGIPFIAAPIGKNCLIVYDGNFLTYKQTDAPATIKDGRTLLPMRFFLEALGSKLWWIPKDKKIVAVIPWENTDSVDFWQLATKLEMWIDYPKARVNGGVYTMPSSVPPQIIQNRTYVPLRFIGEMTGWIAEWDSENKIAVIHY